MPKANDAKTKWAPKHTYARWVAVVLFVSILLVAVVNSQKTDQPTTKLIIKGHTYVLEHAATTAAHQKGLGGRQGLGQNNGMLFLFSSEQVRCFWMKDVPFPLDIVWVNARKQVVHIEQRIHPNTYPKPYCPDKPAQYVIELNAGEVHKVALRPGQQLQF